MVSLTLVQHAGVPRSFLSTVSTTVILIINLLKGESLCTTLDFGV
jgi:hypothetical protein